MKNKLKYGLTLAALAFLVGCSDKGSIQRPSVGSGSTIQDSSSIINSESANSNTSDTTSDSTSSEIDPFELSSYQYYPLPDKTLAIAVGNNKYLEKLTLPEQYQGRKVTQIAENGFKDCRALREISIPSSVLTIGNYAFSGCSVLSNIIIPESMASIGNGTFEGCSSLTSIIIPDGVTNIGDSAFSGCSSLTSIVIPESVTSIGAGTFYDCSSLTICCQAQSKPSGWDKDWNYSNRPVVWGCSGIGALGSLNYRIDYKNGEESITIFGCAGTDSEAVIPETIGGVEVTAIADSAFKGCSSLISIVIPDGVTTIGDCAFYGCSSLTSIVIPDGVTSIGNLAFYDCSSLAIYCRAQSKPSGWSSSWNLSHRPVVWGYIRAGDQDCFEYAVSSIDGAECATITGYAGSDTGIAVPETIGGIKVAAIANSAFAGCTFLTSIAIPEGVTTIGDYSFYGCSSLTSIAIPEGVTNIGYAAFSGCSVLSNIVIPERVTTIGDYSFWGCSSLTSIAIPDGVTNIGNSAFYGCSSLASIVIPEGVTSIGRFAFAGCTSLASIAIPNSVTNIGGYAFEGCSSLKGIVIPDGVTTIDAYAFSRCSSLTIYCQAQSKPSGWDYYWNDSDCPVVWGYSGNGTSGSLN